MSTVVLLTLSNIFMIFAWCGHLKYRVLAPWQVILGSWGIAFVECSLEPPQRGCNATGQEGWTGARSMAAASKMRRPTWPIGLTAGCSAD